MEQSTLDIRLLGRLEVLRAGEPLALPRSKKTRALLGYLVATRRRATSRQQLCDLLERWVEEDENTVLLLTGPPGIGKTRLLEELGAQVRAAGGRAGAGGPRLRRRNDAALRRLDRRAPHRAFRSDPAGVACGAGSAAPGAGAAV